jgi:hypothetical protein
MAGTLPFPTVAVSACFIITNFQVTDFGTDLAGTRASCHWYPTGFGVG